MPAAEKPMRPGVALAARRELRRIARRPALSFFVLAFPLLIFLVLASIFRAGVPTDLPVAVLDLDRSSLSRQIVQAVDVAPEVAVAWRPLDLSEARHLVLSGRAYGVVLVPAEFERDLRAGRQPHQHHVGAALILDPRRARGELDARDHRQVGKAGWGQG